LSSVISSFSIFALSYNLIRHKQNVRHNSTELSDSHSGQSLDSVPESLDFIAIPMSVDTQVFDGDACELEVGNFVSFRYIAENNGAPISPKISNNFEFLLLYLFDFRTYMQSELI
jgi:hypothetical protein